MNGSAVDHDEQLDNAQLEALAGQICARAAQQAQASCRLLELIGDFDAGGGLGVLRGVKSVAHWLAHSCSMSPGAAREHVRVARALRRMPTLTAAFGAGRLSYSKVREATRLVDQVDEARLCDLARSTSASQLARAVRGFRAASGTRIGQQERRRFTIAAGEDQLASVIARLPLEEAAIVRAAINLAHDLDRIPPPSGSDRNGETALLDPLSAETADAGTSRYTDVDAFVDIFRHFLATAGTGVETGEDRSLVVVEVAAEQLLGAMPNPATPGAGSSIDALSDGPADAAVAPALAEDVPAGTHHADYPDDGPAGTPHGGGIVVAEASCRAELAPDPHSDVPAGTPGGEGVPAGTSGGEDVPAGTRAIPRESICGIRGLSGIEPATAARLTCTGTILGAVVSAHGDVLALGRTRRLASKTQRRALMLRDQRCQFPGCARIRHLEAHHVTPWSRGGRTDLDELILLCRFHHMTVHEGGVRIGRTPLDREHCYAGARTGATPWTFTMPDGEVLPQTGPRLRSAEVLIRGLISEPVPAVDHLRSLADSLTRTIRPDQTGERFDLQAAVQALFGMTAPTGLAA